ncbi:MAG: chemotaxis protein CheW [Endozoicomonas sp.]
MSSSTHPFDYLETLAQNVSLYAAPLPTEQSDISKWQGISFLLNKQQYVVPLGSVTEILLVPQITPLPGVKQWVKGIANVRGRLIPIISLNDFLNIENSISGLEKSQHGKAGISNRILILEKKDMSVGLILEEVQGMMQFSVNTFSEEVPASLPPSVRPYIQGSYQKNHHYVVFNIEDLITSEHFLKAASE